MGTSPTEPQDMYSVKNEQYFAGVRDDYLSRLPTSEDAAILEIGCGRGDTGKAALQQRKCGRYCAVELFPDAAASAAEALTQVVVGDVESVDLPWEPETFDVLVMSEVLEHLVDPWACVQKLRPLIKRGGVVFASSPNVAHYAVIRMLLHGEWRLDEFGPMDRTHLRWFTPRSFQEMFEQAGFRVETVGPVAPMGPKARMINAVSFGKMKHLLWRQISISGCAV